MNLYDCDFCIANKLYEGRHCFLEEFPGQEENSIRIPLFDSEDFNPNVIGEEVRLLNKEGIFEELETLEAVFPHLSPFELLLAYFNQPKEVCPTSLVDPHHNFLLEMEFSCREYKCLPYDGGYLDQPLLLMGIFHTIQSEKAAYERARMSKMKKEFSSKKKPSSSSKPRTPQLPQTRGGDSFQQDV